MIEMPKNCRKNTKEDIAEPADENSSASSSNNGNGGGGRNLRKRTVNLNRLASSISTPMVCEFQHCGVQLADGDTLEVSFFYKSSRDF